MAWRPEILRAGGRRLNAVPLGEVITLRDALDHQVDAIRDGDPCIAEVAARLGVTITEPLTLDDARSLVAREHYFKGWWGALEHGDRIVDRRFEAAADAIVAGELDVLERLLDEDPALVRARSPYGHRQMLLHHVAANGVEVTRQWQSPANAADIARVLLAAGAEPDATCESYGTNDTTMTLLCSSAHPAIAGVQADIVAALVAGGARIDGTNADCTPLWTALIFGYDAAVDRLVALGARKGNPVLAAAAGDLAEVKRDFPGTHGDVLLPFGRERTLAGIHLLEYALIYAAGMNRRDVVAYLLTLGPDLSITEPVWGATALGIAKHPHEAAHRPHGNPDVIALLEASA